MGVRMRAVVAVVAVLATTAIAAVWIGWNHTGTAARQGQASTLSGGDTSILALAAAVLVVIEEWWRRTAAADRNYRAAVASSTASAGGRWPVLGEIVDLQMLGVRPPREPSLRKRARLQYAGRHILDGRLREALTLHRFVLVHGPSAAGKSCSTVQAAIGLYPDRPVVVPELRPGHLEELLREGAVPEQAVVWLDDLDRHVDGKGGALAAGTITRLLAIEGVRVVATMRAGAFEQYKPRGEIRPAGRDVIDLAELVEFTGWDATDCQAAAVQLAGHADIVAALDKGMGLGEYLAAGPDLVERLERGTPPPAGVALVRAAGDWYRAGMTRPVPAYLLQKLFPIYLPDDDHRLIEAYPQAIEWACEPVSGARLLTARTDGSGIAVHDYVLDYLTTQSRPIPVMTLRTLANSLADQPADLNTLGVTAYLDLPDYARLLVRQAAEAGHTDAMFNLGMLLEKSGRQRDLMEAERWYRQAADAGHANAMVNLGVLLVQRAGSGDLAEAEGWYHQAAEAGHAEAMFNLGMLLVQRGDEADLAKGEGWYRQAAEAGHAEAMFNLGMLLEEHGGERDLVQAKGWYRQAADAGDTDAMVRLAALLKHRGGPGDLAEAEGWYRQAADAGDTVAMFSLARLLKHRGGPGDLAQAEGWYRQAADAGDTDAMVSLGILLMRRGGPGDQAQAEGWYRQAIDAGHTVAMFNLGILLEERGGPEDLAEAEQCYRQAADAGDTDATINLGILLEGKQ